MKPVLTPMRSRALAILLLLVACALLGLALYLPVRGAHLHYDTAIEENLDRMARYLRIAAQKKQVETDIAAIKGKDARRHYLKAASPALAAAEVQQLAQAIIDANALKVESTQIAPHKDEQGRRKVTINYRLRGQLPALQKMLYELEMLIPYVFIDNLVFRSSVVRAFRPVPGVEPEVLVQFDLYGFALVNKPGGLGAAAKP